MGQWSVVLICFCLSDTGANSAHDFGLLDFSLLLLSLIKIPNHKQNNMFFVILELVYNHTSLLINILLFQSYNVLLLYMYMYNFIYGIPILEWVLYIYLTQTNTTMIIINVNLISRSIITMTFYLINIIFKFHKFEISIIVKTIYLNLEFHRVFRDMSLIALYIVHVTYRYVRTKCRWLLTILSSYKNMSGLLDSINNVPTMKKNINFILDTISNYTFPKSVYTLITVCLIICDVTSSLTMPYCNQVIYMYLVTGFLYTTQFAHVQVVTVLKNRTHSLVVFIIIDLYCLITIVSYNHRFMTYDVNVNPRSTCSTYVNNIDIKMLIDISYYISLILLGQKCLYMIIILYQKINT